MEDEPKRAKGLERTIGIRWSPGELAQYRCELADCMRESSLQESPEIRLWADRAAEVVENGQRRLAAEYETERDDPMMLPYSPERAADYRAECAAAVCELAEYQSPEIQAWMQKVAAAYKAGLSLEPEREDPE